MQGWQLFQIVAIFTILLAHEVNSSVHECRDAVAPPTKPRGVNQINRSSFTPIFKLHLHPFKPESGKKNNFDAYKVSVSIEEGFQLQMSEVTLSVSVNGSCGTGDFDFLAGDFDDIVQDDDDQCPRLLHTRQLQSMKKLPPLVWTPPSCGCVRIRILIIDSEQAYYADNEGLSKGPLLKTICFNQQHQKPSRISRKQRLGSLCHVIDKHSSNEIISRSQFLSHRRIDRRYMDYLGLEMAMELRRSDVMTCCSMKFDADKTRCFEAARRRRIDGYCDDGVPDIPFKNFRQKHMKLLEKSCCFILGEERYRCFAGRSDTGKKVEGGSIFDYSLDASDVVNDLADFGSHEHLDERLRPIGQEYDDDNNDDVDEEEEEEEEDEEEEKEDMEDESNGSVNMEDSIDLDQVSEEILVGTDMEIEELQDEEGTAPKINTDQTSPVRPTSQQTVSRMPSRKSLPKKNLSKLAMRRKRKRKNRNSKEARRSSNEKRRSSERRSQRRRGSRVGNSKERKDRRSRSSAEKRNRKDRGGRRPMTKEDLETSEQFGFDDQGGSSTDRTLKKLNRKMKRLKLQRMCCRAGGEIGNDVYGGLSQVTNECNHGSSKFIGSIKLGSKKRKCVDHFVRCCTEQAIKGLTMTSQEFVENSLFNKWDNNQQFDAKLFDRVLSKRGRNSRIQNNRRAPKIQMKNRNMVPQSGFASTNQDFTTMEETGRKATPAILEQNYENGGQIKSNMDDNMLKKTKFGKTVSQETAIRKKVVESNPDEIKGKTIHGVNTRRGKKQSRKQSSLYTKPNRKLNIHPVGALDSREMAEINTKTYKDALDSREMADQYVNKRKKSKWYRSMRRYRNRPSGKRWRSRFG